MFTKFQSIKQSLQLGNLPKCNFYNPSIFDEFLLDSETRCSDITFLFNQQRLDKIISADNFNSYFHKLLEDAGANPYAGMSDDEILQFVKDRRMGSFNDWYNYTRQAIQDTSDLENYKSHLEREHSIREEQSKRYNKHLKSLGLTDDDVNI